MVALRYIWCPQQVRDRWDRGRLRIDREGRRWCLYLGDDSDGGGWTLEMVKGRGERECVVYWYSIQ